MGRAVLTRLKMGVLGALTELAQASVTERDARAGGRGPAQAGFPISGVRRSAVADGGTCPLPLECDRRDHAAIAC